MIDNKSARESMLNLQHVRLKCLKLAVQSADPEAELDVRGILGRAQVLFNYVINGEIPAAVTVPVMATGEETVADYGTVTTGDGTNK
jgi:hypothetical protein